MRLSAFSCAGKMKIIQNNSTTFGTNHVSCRCEPVFIQLRTGAVSFSNLQLTHHVFNIELYPSYLHQVRSSKLCFNHQGAHANAMCHKWVDIVVTLSTDCLKNLVS